jgi:hypothetical protein
MRLLHVLILAIIAIIVSYYILGAFVLQQHAVNKQSVYVHLQKEWKSYPANIVYDITNVWSKTNTDPPTTEARLEIAKQTNVDQIRYTHNKSYILVQHDNTDCRDVWVPHYARFGADVIRHQIEYVSGLQKSPDPNITLYTSIHSKQDDSTHKSQMISGYSQFIPACTEKNSTTFDYSLRINDDSIGFDVYFVSSIEEQANYDDNGVFRHYDDGQCFGTNYSSFSGTCYGVSKGSGLLVVIPDNLSLPLTKVDVWLYERSG